MTLFEEADHLLEEIKQKLERLRQIMPLVKNWGEAKARYDHFTDNHPTIHSNRFPTWNELSMEERSKWRDPSYKGE